MNNEQKIAAMVAWLEVNQPDVFRRGLWDAIAAPAASRVMLPVTDDLVSEAVRAYIQAGKRGCDLYNAMKSAVESVLAASPVAGWVSVEERLPECDMKAGSLGVEVIVYPKPEKGESTAFFGCRLTNEPDFYKYGSRVGGVTHWMPLPPAPVVTPTQQEQSNG